MNARQPTAPRALRPLDAASGPGATMSHADETTTALPTRALRAPGRRTAGFSLVEVLVALAIFVLVILAAYQVYIRSLEASKLGSSLAEMTQSGRIALDQLVHEIRLAGFEYDVDGPLTSYPQQPDEPLEYMHPHAIALRANFNHESDLGGREPSLEYMGDDNFCCPIVTTSNREIVVYALGKSPGDPDQPDDTITMYFDTSGTMDEPGADGTYDDDIRDATVSPGGVIANQEEVTIGDVHLGDPTDPPYTLYRFTWDENGTLLRQPLVDNVASLDFRYYDEQGNEVVPTANEEGSDDANAATGPNRSARASVRRVDISVNVLASDPDMRWDDPDAPNEYARQRRNYEFATTVIPKNLATRGQIDRSINEPSPPTNVQVTTGCCRWIRVEWEPPPVEERVKDYVVSLYTGPPDPSDLTNLVASFIVQSKLDLTQDPPREYATWTYENDSDIQNGQELYATVVARSEGGSESEPAPTDPDPPVSATVGQGTRPGFLASAYGTGYDDTATAWPDARADNDAAGAQIVVDDTSPFYPRAGTVQLTIQPPGFVLNEGAPTGDDGAGTNWTTRSLTAGVVAALDGTSEGATRGKGYHLAEWTPEDTNTDLRTPFNNFSTTNNTYVFRVSGSDPWNWDGEWDSNAQVESGVVVTDPRNFVPGPANLLDLASLSLGSGTTTYTDESEYNFTEYGTAGELRDDYFSSTGTHLTAYAATIPSVRAVTPGEVYYYRFRVTDLCWQDGNADGQEDTTFVKAWEVQGDDTADETEWRTAAMPISPFYPPLIPAGSSGEDRLLPSDSVHDSDQITRPSGIDSYAIPGYALPPEDADETMWKPAAPNELYLGRQTGTTHYSWEGARVMFNASRRSDPDSGDPLPVAITHYALHRIPAGTTDVNAITSATLDFTPSPANEFLRFRSSGPLSLLRYTLDTAEEGAPEPALTTRDCSSILNASGEPVDEGGTTPLDLDDLERLKCLGEAYDGTGQPFVYRLVALQAPDWGVNDDIDTSAVEQSDPSPPFVFPCDVTDQIRVIDLTVTPDSINTTSVSVEVGMNDGPDPMSALEDPDCTDINAARLLGYRDVTEDFTGTSEWIDVLPGADGTKCTFEFGSDEVDAARRGHSGVVNYVVEVSTASIGGSLGWEPVAGCRVRSDNLGEACENCGSLSVPDECEGCATDKLFDNITVNVDPDDDTILNLDVPIVCDTDEAFTLLQVEVFLRQEPANPARPIPPLQSARVIDLDGVGDPISGSADSLPIGDGADHRTDLSPDEDETEVQLRWYENIIGAEPLISGDAESVRIELNFTDRVCDLFVDQFNFRIPTEDGGVPGEQDELLCTNSGEDPMDPNVTVNPDGGGRSDAGGPYGTCGPTGCTPYCLTALGEGTCPLQDCDDTPGAMDTNPEVLIVADDASAASRRLEATWGHTCEDCDVSISSISVALEKPTNCQVFFGSCIGGIPDLVGGNDARLIVDTGMGPPDSYELGAPDVLDQSACCNSTYEWTGLDLTLPSGSTLKFQADFAGAMTGVRYTELTVTIPADDDPLPPPVGGGDTITCHLVDNFSLLASAGGTVCE